MRKPKKTKRRSLPSSREVPFKPTPVNHRFDQEISDVASTTLLKLELSRSSKKVSMESGARKRLRELIAQRKLTSVAAQYYETILRFAAKNPLRRVVIPLLESTFDEFYSVKKHMDAFCGKPMKLRLENMFSMLRDNSWLIIDDHKEDNDLPEGINCIGLCENYLCQFNENGDILTSITIMARTKDRRELSNIAYRNGVIFYDETYPKDFCCIVFYPDNNIPLAPLLPVIFR